MKSFKILTDKGSIIILYESQTLMNTYYCLLSTFTMEIYCYKAGMQTAEQDCVYVEKLSPMDQRLCANITCHSDIV